MKFTNPCLLKPFLDKWSHEFLTQKDVDIYPKDGGFSNQVCGAYVIFHKDYGIMYIGTAKMLRQRIREHLIVGKYYIKRGSIQEYIEKDYKIQEIDIASLNVVVFIAEGFIERIKMEHELLNSLESRYNMVKE
jgi:excinuclease UvrABC nuclease subunit